MKAGRSCFLALFQAAISWPLKPNTGCWTVKLLNGACFRQLGLAVAVMSLLAMPSHAAEIQRYSLTISKIRAVGNYQGAMHHNSVELWFTTSLSLPGGLRCSDSARAVIDGNNTHMIAAAYQALASKSRVSINLDDTLPVRGGACEISFLDIGGQ